MTIRKQNPNEWPAYRALRLESLTTDPQAFGATLAHSLTRPDEWWRGRLESAQEGSANLLLFAEEEGQLVGMIGSFPAEEPRAINLISMYVLASHRGLGIGGKLVDQLVEEIRRTGDFDTLVLDVNSNQAAAVALYRSAGFEVIAEEEVDEPGGGRHLQYSMRRSLI